jgi:hypothetical protein
MPNLEKSRAPPPMPPPPVPGGVGVGLAPDFQPSTPWVELRRTGRRGELPQPTFVPLPTWEESAPWLADIREGAAHCLARVPGWRRVASWALAALATGAVIVAVITAVLAVIGAAVLGVSLVLMVLLAAGMLGAASGFSRSSVNAENTEKRSSPTAPWWR